MSKACTLAGTYAVEALRSQLQEMQDQLEPLRREDPNGVHDMRVASRRLRAVLSEHARLLDEDLVKKVQKNVRTVTRTLGQAREMDVSLAALEAMMAKLKGPAKAAAAHAFDYLEAERAKASPAIADAVALIGSDLFNDGIQLLIQRGLKCRRCYFKHASRRTFKLFSIVTEAHFDWLRERTDPKLHAVRIALKKFRYACEIYRDLYGSGMKDLINQLKDSQDALGDWHDYCVLRDYVAHSAATAPPNVAAGMEALERGIEVKVKKHLDRFAKVAEVFFTPLKQEETFAFLVGDE